MQLNGSEILDIPTKSTLDLERDEDALSDCEYLNATCQKVIARSIQTECSSHLITRLGSHPSQDVYVQSLECKNAET